MQEHEFFNITLANLVSWILIVAAFVATQWVTVKLLGHRMTIIESWIVEHKGEAKARDQLDVSLSKAVVELSTLAKVAKDRLEMLERRGKGHG